MKSFGLTGYSPTVLISTLTLLLAGVLPLHAEPAAMDLSKIPLPPGTKPVHVDSLSAIHSTESTVDSTTEACEKLLLDQGWEPFGSAGMTRYYKRGLVRLLVTIQKAGGKDAKTMITYNSEKLEVNLPLPPGVEEVQCTDGSKRLGFLTALTPEGVADFYRTALASEGWSTTMEKPDITDFKHVIIFRSPEKGMIEIQMKPMDGKVRAALKYSTAAEVAAEKERVAEGMSALKEKLAKEAAAPKRKVTLTLPASTTSKALTKSNLKLNITAGKAKEAVEAFRNELAAAGWKETIASLEPVGGTLGLTLEKSSLNITYMDPGFMPAEITVTPTDAEIELAGSASGK